MESTRRYDLFFTGVFALMAVSVFLVDSLNAFGVPLHAESPCPWARFVFHYYAENCDPFYAANPFFNRMASTLSVFLFGPLYIYFAVGFYRGDKTIRVPALVFSGALIYAMLVHIGYEFLNPQTEMRIQNMAKYLSTNLLYLIVPVVLVFRLRKGF